MMGSGCVAIQAIADIKHGRRMKVNAFSYQVTFSCLLFCVFCSVVVVVNGVVSDNSWHGGLLKNRNICVVCLIRPPSMMMMMMIRWNGLSCSQPLQLAKYAQQRWAEFDYMQLLR